MNKLLRSSIALIAGTLSLAFSITSAIASEPVVKYINQHNLKNSAEVHVDFGRMYISNFTVEMHDHDENYKFDIYIREANGTVTKVDSYHDISTNNQNPNCEGTINDYGNHESLTDSCYEIQTVNINKEIAALKFVIYGDAKDDGNVHIRKLIANGGNVQGTTDDFCKEDSKFPQVFRDVPVNSMYYEHVQELECHNVVHGYSDGTFRLYAPITRGEMAKIISNGMRMEEYVTCGGFRDLHTSNKFYVYIMTLKCRGVVNGYSDGSYRPDQYVTRAEAMKFIINGARIRTNNPNFLVNNSYLNMFSDVNAYDPAYQYIMAGQSANAYTDLRNNQFRPDNMITRGEFALYMNIIRREIDKTVIDYSSNNYSNYGNTGYATYGNEYNYSSSGYNYGYVY
jgi:hypothetical protein